MHYIGKAYFGVVNQSLPLNTDCLHLSVVMVVVEIVAVAVVAVVVVVLETLLTAHPVLQDTSDYRSLLHPQTPVMSSIFVTRMHTQPLHLFTTSIHTLVTSR